MRRLVAVAALAIALTGWIAAPSPGQSAPKVSLREVGSAESPVGIVNRHGDASLYVIEQRGVLRPLGKGAPVLDVRGDVSTSGNEQGLLGAAFSNDGAFAYINFTNKRGDTEVREYAWRNGRLDPGSKRLVIKIAQPEENHNGGHVAIDRSGLLWIGMGDGGGGGDAHGSIGNGQNLKTLLGKILRIDPRRSGGRAYSIPPTNPFADGKKGRPEIWAYGLRNPWRFSFDEVDKMLWIGDVGQGEWEEVDAVPLDRGGINFGWRRREGRHAYENGSKPAGAVDPVWEASHGTGACSVTGGYVYRGSAIKGLQGAYVFGDFCQGDLTALVKDGSGWAPVDLGAYVDQLTSFGVDNNGEMYVTSREGPIYRLEG